MKSKYNYEWNLKNTKFTKDKGSVFSCFACGGGSTMGYKLAGFDVIGFNEIDPKMANTYIKNHNPKYKFIEPIQAFKDKKLFPDELYNLDILDGSPPCSSFSMSGNRSKDWGKNKKFKEGQSLQILDTLFFDFISLAKRLQPKIVVAENVKGIIQGDAKKYVIKIYKEFEKAGYYCQHFLLNAKNMGVPQSRERVFFICLRKDLASKFLIKQDLFNKIPFIDLSFNYNEITYSEIRENNGNKDAEGLSPKILELWKKTKPGNSLSKAHPTGSYFNEIKLSPNKVVCTIRANGLPYDYQYERTLYNKEVLKCGTFPMDYDFNGNKAHYIVGMSVPPIMVAEIASKIYEQWLKKL